MKDTILEFDETDGTVRADVARPRHASFSSLDSWRSCPGRWLAGRALPRRYEWDSPLVLGSLAHGALQLAVTRQPDVAHPDWHALVEAAVPMLREENRATGWKPDPIPDGVAKPDGSPMMEADWVDGAAAKLDGFRLTDVFGVPLHPAAAEQELRETIWGIPMTGSVDYRDAERGVVDWKTGRKPDRDSGRMRHADQLRVYKALLETAGVCEVRRARDVYVEHRTFETADLSDEAMAATGSRMARAWNEMNRCVGAGEFPLRPSGLCGWCPLANACPAATLYGAKARAAAARQWPADDARFRLARPATDPVAGFGLPAGTQDGGENTRKETGVDLFEDLLDGTPAPKPEPVKPAEPERGVDPWETAAGKAALEKWGVPGKAEPAQAEPTGKAEPAQAEPTGKAEPAQAEPTGKAEPKEPEPTGKAESGKAEPTVGKCLVFGKPFEPTVRDGDALNANAYGFSASIMLSATAAIMCGSALSDRTRDTELLVLRLEWAAARTVFGANVPDVPGLADGNPEPEALGRWLDSTLARDTNRVFMRVAERAGLMERSDVPMSWDMLSAKLKAVGEAAVSVLRDARTLWRA